MYSKLLFYYIPTLSIALLYFFAGMISIKYLHSHSIVTLGVFPSEGISLAFVLFFGLRVLPGIFTGQLIFALYNNIIPAASLEISLINTLEAFIAYKIFYSLRLDIQLRTFKDIILLLLMIMFILQPFSALASNSFLLYHNAIQSSEFFTSSFSWWFGNSMGQFLFTPFFLLLFVNYKTLSLKKYFLYTLLFGIYIYTLEILLALTNPLLLLSLTIPIIVFIISHEGFSYGALLSVVVALVSSYTVHLEIGPFSLKDINENTINYNLFVLAHIAVVLVTGVLFEERKKNIMLLKKTIFNEIEKNEQQQLLLLQQSRLAQMGEMIAMIAHQWRQPLNNLSLINQLLVSKFNKGNINAETIEYFKVNSNKQINQMSSTIDDFRNFFEPTKEKKVFSLNKLIDDMLNITQNIYTTLNIDLVFTPNKEYFVYGYYNELGQAILNIINNSKDALSELTINNKRINIMLIKGEKNIVLSITDNAGGITKEISEKMFDPYFSTKKEKNGTGLGLYMAKIIIEDKLNGEILFTNTDTGAQFDILLKGVENAS